MYNKASDQAQEGFFQTRIEIGVPSRKCLELLARYFSTQKSYKLSYFEITRDIICRTKEEAEEKATSLFMTMRRRYTSKGFIYDIYFDDSKRLTETDGLFSRRTAYFGPDKFRYTCYPRLSKINGQPCLHDEWRISGALIKEKTGRALPLSLL